MNDISVDMGPAGVVKLSEFVDIARDEAGKAWDEFTPEQRTAMERAGRDVLMLGGQAARNPDPSKFIARELAHVEFQVKAWTFATKGAAQRAFWRATERIAKRGGEVLLALAVKAGTMALASAI